MCVPCGIYRGADKSLARPTSRCILFEVENISFDASLVIYINSTNIPPIMIINKIVNDYKLYYIILYYIILYYIILYYIINKIL